tara:strand:+ start:2163 stop:2414 length:252 start_codon:yes stop_codon:yes gene_type:complete
MKKKKEVNLNKEEIEYLYESIMPIIIEQKVDGDVEINKLLIKRKRADDELQKNVYDFCIRSHREDNAMKMSILDKLIKQKELV